MIYKNFKDKKLSSLGMGCMRFPVLKGEHYSKIDVDATRDMIAYAFSKGINYFDTAWGYHDGNSQTVLGELLKEYPRESFYLANKFPGYDRNNINKVGQIFEAQLKKCQVDYFDFYMFHNVCEENIDAYLDTKHGVYDYLMEQKKNGRIKHLGFSAHGNLDTIKRFLNAYGKDMEFCQIQLNWLDWKLQNAKAKVELLKEWNIPIWVMEPIRGGKLAEIEPVYKAELDNVRPNMSAVEWAFRFLQAIPEVVVTLSGMSNAEQLKENITIFEDEKPLTDDEVNALLKEVDKMTAKATLPCTACRYCTTHCPMQLDIPWIIELYNDHVYSGGGFLAPAVIGSFKEDKKPSACVACRACEAVCPQNIKISEMMSDFTNRLK